MRVLHFYKTYYPNSYGGVEQVIFQLAEGGRRLGLETEVLSLSPHGCARNQPVGQHLGHYARRDIQLASTGFSLSAIGAFRELAADADLVHYHFPWPFMDLLHFIVPSHKPSVVSYHSDIVRQQMLLRLYSPLMQRFLSSAGRIVAASPNYVQSSEVLQRHRDKVRVIPYGLDETTYARPSTQALERWRARLGDRFFLFVGVLRYYKGLHVLLEAAAGAPYPIVIAGAGPVEHELREQAARLGLSNLHLLGEVDEEDKAALFQLSQAMVFPSHLRSEAFGISLLEGAMFGKPLISCEIGTGTSYINLHEETGLVVPPADAPALRRAMDRLWQAPELCRSMGLQARQRFERLFTSERMNSQYAALYRELLEPVNIKE
jgi:rhamnosyl/mannosyltransferase